ncbi:hypothetical protein DPEC_G00079320 [Dallia pectoralis]|uniref:Uncharacterized protein n=1 Tax=Dallia pectoralis TaxID=75939 RepID=A0ACC2H4E7_DALPE|nr:hypothetical protein DPEC_G00079320 [Dallia pectoralis]
MSLLHDQEEGFRGHNSLLDTSFGVYLDYTDVLTQPIDDITLAMATLMYIYLVFNIQYHKKVKTLLLLSKSTSSAPQGKNSTTVIKMVNGKMAICLYIYVYYYIFVLLYTICF